MLFPLYDLNPHRRFPWFTLLLIAINVAITAWTSTLGDIDTAKLALEPGFIPARLSQLGKGPIVVPLERINPQTDRVEVIGRVQLDASPSDVYPTFLTTMFLHGGWMHLAMNMWMLWIFGNNIEDRLGHFLYLCFYLGGGILATLAYWLSDPNGGMPVIGASGAVAAVLGGYAVTYPTAKVKTLIFFFLIVIVDMPALMLLGIWFTLQIASGLMGLWGVVLEPVAFWAHIGGFVAGMLLMPLLSLGSSPPGADWRKETDELFRFDDPRLSGR